MGFTNEYGDLSKFVKMFLILFHGQSEVERGSSVNKQLLVENFKPKSLIALRKIEDHVNFLELCPETIKISNELIKNVKEAHRRYRETKKTESEKEKKQNKSKSRETKKTKTRVKNFEM